MECETINKQLVSYYFGAIKGDSLVLCTEHVRHCPDCLDAFLEIKMNAELAPQEHELPAKDLYTRIKGKSTFLPPVRKVFYRGALIAASLILVWSLASQFIENESAPVERVKIQTDSAREVPIALSLL